MMDSFFPRVQSQTFFVTGFIILTLIYYSAAYKESLQHLSAHRDHLVKGLNQWFFNNINCLYPNQIFANSVITQGIHQGYYHPPGKSLVKPEKFSIPKIRKSEFCKQTPENSLDFFINPIIIKSDSNHWIRLEGMYFETEAIGQDNTILDLSKSVEYQFQTVQAKRSQPFYRKKI